MHPLKNVGLSFISINHVDNVLIRIRNILHWSPAQLLRHNVIKINFMDIFQTVGGDRSESDTAMLKNVDYPGKKKYSTATPLMRGTAIM